MRRVGFILVILLLMFAYRFANKERNIKEGNTTRTTTVENRSIENNKASKVISIAQSYNGVNYKFGGKDKNGMDCSGLLFTSFKKIGVQLPRTSSAMSSVGEKIDIDEIKLGDLIFFDIDRLKGKINHVGMVVSLKNNEIKFIHSSTSKGVTTSSLNESYWKDAFVKVKRIL